MNIEEDVLPAFGDEMGGYLKDIRVGSLFPGAGVFVLHQDRG